ncbi:hypothetical protein [Solitalea canadensis]|uniref:DUF4595 domain-containing protein n=1 Tax=Solitalea canadensis (strain ATCC 29591 / DSM 3403 / JCM 21819 / LMG 8368 / NBRC 15130 / NCIMB 12057 / USAM 9D) TaxID=929556 RepID=H8KLF0_SOLCM|nr:hypothetical protein [Solitalea canadensis]AFD08652.1 hypothetical protein Solca_3648 [Solitalea canadensis DSM 3403]
MKTYALYLLILCFSVIGCQKDIAENEADLAAKKDKDCKCKILYLPVKRTLEDTTALVMRFEYHDKVGNLSLIRMGKDGGPYLKVYYNDKTEITKVEYFEWYGLRYEYLITYKNNKIYKCKKYELKNGSSEFQLEWTLDWNKDALKEVIETNIIEPTYGAQQKYQYLNPKEPNKILSWSVVHPWNSINALYETNEKNYWAKDIKNKELYFLIFSDPSGNVNPARIVPSQKEINNMSSFRRSIDFTYDTIRVLEAEYNEHDYPIRTVQEQAIHWEGDGWFYEKYNSTIKTFYEKIIVK